MRLFFLALQNVDCFLNRCWQRNTHQTAVFGYADQLVDAEADYYGITDICCAYLQDMGVVKE